MHPIRCFLEGQEKPWRVGKKELRDKAGWERHLFLPKLPGQWLEEFFLELSHLRALRWLADINPCFLSLDQREYCLILFYISSERKRSSGWVKEWLPPWPPYLLSFLLLIMQAQISQFTETGVPSFMSGESMSAKGNTMCSIWTERPTRLLIVYVTKQTLAPSRESQETHLEL